MKIVSKPYTQHGRDEHDRIFVRKDPIFKEGDIIYFENGDNTDPPTGTYTLKDEAVGRLRHEN